MSVTQLSFLEPAPPHSRIINVASVPQRSPFRYPGGKTWLVPHLRRWLESLPRPAEFIEPFTGGGIISLTVAFEELAEHVTMVELDQQVAAVWQAILGKHGQWLAERIVNFQLTPKTVDEALAHPSRTLQERAFQTILKNRVNRGGILALGGLTLALGGLLFAFYLRRPTTLKLEVDKTTFYPNQPGDVSFVAVRVTLSRGSKVTLVVRDQMDREVLALVENRNYNSGQHLRLWNGRASMGQTLPSGVYQIEASASAFLSSTVNSAVWVQLDAAASALAASTQTTTRPPYRSNDDQVESEVS